MSLTRVFAVLPSFWDRIKPKQEAPKLAPIQPIIQHCVVEEWKKPNIPKNQPK